MADLTLKLEVAKKARDEAFTEEATVTDDEKEKFYKAADEGKSSPFYGKAF